LVFGQDFTGAVREGTGAGEVATGISLEGGCFAIAERGVLDLEQAPRGRQQVAVDREVLEGAAAGPDLERVRETFEVGAGDGKSMGGERGKETQQGSCQDPPARGRRFSSVFASHAEAVSAEVACR